MNYQKIYNQLIENAKLRKDPEYYEIHHIVPKCMGGSNDTDNLVKLTLREHYIVHRLLYFIYPKNKSLANAYWLMSNRIINDKTIHITSREYEEGKKAYIDSTKGVKRNSNQCKSISDATKSNMRANPETIEKCRVNKGSRWYRDKKTGKTYKWYPGDPDIDLEIYEWGRSKMPDEQKKKISEFKDIDKTYYYIPELDITYVAYEDCIKEVPQTWIKGSKGSGAGKIKNLIVDAARIFNLKTGYVFETQIFFKYKFKSKCLEVFSPAVYEICYEELKKGNIENIAEILERNIQEIIELNKKYLK